jgi:hypothetical protein
MSEEELVFRMVSGMSGIPVYLLESGKWRSHGYKNLTPEEVVNKVRSVWSKMKGIKILYENVAGMDSEEMVSLLKRIYYSEIGRGNPLIFSFDYLKTHSAEETVTYAVEQMENDPLFNAGIGSQIPQTMIALHSEVFGLSG